MMHELSQHRSILIDAQLATSNPSLVGPEGGGPVMDALALQMAGFERQERDESQRWVRMVEAKQPIMQVMRLIDAESNTVRVTEKWGLRAAVTGSYVEGGLEALFSGPLGDYEVSFRLLSGGKENRSFVNVGEIGETGFERATLMEEVRDDRGRLTLRRFVAGNIAVVQRRGLMNPGEENIEVMEVVAEDIITGDEQRLALMPIRLQEWVR